MTTGWVVRGFSLDPLVHISIGFDPVLGLEDSFGSKSWSLCPPNGDSSVDLHKMGSGFLIDLRGQRWANDVFLSHPPHHTVVSLLIAVPGIEPRTLCMLGKPAAN